jgi:diacylglycerol kinase
VTRTFSPRERIASFAHAFRGVATLLATQPNARIHAVATAAALALAGALRVAAGEWLALVLAIALVWTAEALNTAIEALGDVASPQPHPLVRRAKDVAAAAVLLAAAGAVGVGVLVFGPRLAGLVSLVGQ